MNSTLITKIVACCLLACATMAGMYAAAATLAGAIGGNFNPAESNRHQHLAEFSSANQDAEALLGAAQFRCDRTFADSRLACRRSALKANVEAHTAARVKYKGSTTIPIRVASTRASDPATLVVAAR